MAKPFAKGLPTGEGETTDRGRRRGRRPRQQAAALPCPRTCTAHCSLLTAVPSPPCLSFPPGSYKWTPGQATPPGTYNIQLLEVVNGSSPTTYAAMGRSLGFFTVRGRELGGRRLVPARPPRSWPRACAQVAATHRCLPLSSPPPPHALSSQIIPINSTPSWLMALVGVFCTLGPLTLTGFFVWERLLKKEK